MQIRHKIWLERNGRVVFGKGREDLLRAIDEMQSLYGAAKKLNMSYRAAWGRLKASEARLGIKLVASGGRGKAMHLTNEARALLEKFDKLEHDAARFFAEMDGMFALKVVKQEMKKIHASGKASLSLLIAHCAGLIPILDASLGVL